VWVWVERCWHKHSHPPTLSGYLYQLLYTNSFIGYFLHLSCSFTYLNNCCYFWKWSVVASTSLYTLDGTTKTPVRISGKMRCFKLLFAIYFCRCIASILVGFFSIVERLLTLFFDTALFIRHLANVFFRLVAENGTHEAMPVSKIFVETYKSFFQASVNRLLLIQPSHERKSFEWSSNDVYTFNGQYWYRTSYQQVLNTKE